MASSIRTRAALLSAISLLAPVIHKLEGKKALQDMLTFASVGGGLGVERIGARPVAVPLVVLLGPISDMGAHFYASFQSSRGEDAGPISRAALERMSGASPRAQQEYDRRSGVETETEFAVGDGETAVGVCRPL